MHARHLALCLAFTACTTKDPATDEDDTVVVPDTDVETDTEVDTDTDVDTDIDTDDVADTIVGTASSTPRFSILVEAVVKAGMADALDGVTVFAPNNQAFQEAFDALNISGIDELSVDQLKVILKYHVLTGSVEASEAIDVANGAGTVDALGGSLALSLDGPDLKVDNATVITPDIVASNGIIHEIDAVLVPNIVDVVTTDADLTTLTSALLAADADASAPDLVGTLGGVGPFTVLAPVNTGFSALLAANGLNDVAGLVNALGMPVLIDVLKYHVAADALYSDEVVAMSSFPTIGGTVTVDVTGSTVTLNKDVMGVNGSNDAVVQVVDLITSNGVIHKISAVLTPATVE